MGGRGFVAVGRASVAGAWSSLGGAERACVVAMLAAILALNCLGWAIFVLAVLPQHLRFHTLGAGLGVGLTAWTLGMRHAFDADHIAAIDNCTRKLLAEGRRPVGAGFFFALGHSSVVVIASIGIAIAARTVFEAVVAPSSAYETAGGVVGAALSATFLLMIAVLNLLVLAGILRVLRDVRRGVYDEAELRARLDSRGLMYRFFGRMMRLVRRTWHMSLVGFVFGIGFDTATEVLLLAGVAAAATQGLPWYALLALPLLFTAGMTLCDAIDGLFMNLAYGWAFERPARKLYYNLTITGLSVAVAFLIGGIEIGGLLSNELHLHGWLGETLRRFDINTAGFAVVGLFVLVWAGALLLWRVGRIEARWEGTAAGTAPRRAVVR
jgi:nickel/cobalt transporter (NiCoT) family protein